MAKLEMTGRILGKIIGPIKDGGRFRRSYNAYQKLTDIVMKRRIISMSTFREWIEPGFTALVLRNFKK